MTKYRPFYLNAVLLLMLTNAAFSQNITDKESQLYLMPSDTVKANVLIALGKHYCSRDIGKALLYLQEALVISTENNYRKGIADSYLYQGRSYYYMDQYGIAFEYLEKARRLYDELADYEGLADYHFASGAINAIIGDFFNAIQDFQAVIRFAENTGNKKLKSLGYQSLGSLHIRRREPDLAISYLNSALQIATENQDNRRISNIMTNMGLVYELIGKPDSALFFMKKGLEIITQMQEKRGIASSGLIIGKLLISMERYTEAIEILKMSESSYVNLNDDTGISIAMMRMAEAFSYLGEIEKAKQMAGHALMLAKQINNPSLTGDVHAILALIHSHARK